MAAQDPASPDTFVRRTMPRSEVAAAAGAAMPTTGKLLVAEMWFEGGDVVTSIGWVTGTTAAVNPTSGFVALYSDTGALLAQSADFAATARAASTAYTSALASAFTIKKPGKHFVVLCIAAGTMPTLLGSVVAPPIATGETAPARESSATYTTTAPAALPALTNRLDLPYMVAV
jgi:hypothetical protein